MPENLIIVESPTKIKSIQKLVGKDYDLAATVGHIRDLPKKELGVDIEADFKPKYVMMAGKKKVIDGLKKEAKKHATIYLACDPDREGEAIAWHIKELLKLKKGTYHRITTNEITKEGLQKALANPREINMDMVNAQQARRILDRIVGYQISPLLWRKIMRGLSAGRVQSVAVKLIVEREKAIKAFVPEEFWKIDALCAKQGKEFKDTVFTAHLAKKDGKKLLVPDGKNSGAIHEELKNLPFTVASIKKKETKSNPQPPFKTSTLQRKASNVLGFSAKKTMLIAQQLYEGIELSGSGSTGLITYMRTDSVRVADSAREACRGYIKETFGDEYLPEKPRFYKEAKRAQEAHEGVRPTDIAIKPEEIKSSLNQDQFKLYRLIWNQFLASQMASARYHSTALTIMAGPYQFNAQGRELLFDGHTRVLGSVKSEVDKQHIPPLDEGEELDVREITPQQHFTKPPPRFTQASLIKTLEEEGIGRPSTYATIISTIQSRHYVSLTKGSFSANLLGITVSDKLDKYFKDVMDVKFTARLEDSLDAVAEKEQDWVKVLKDFYKGFEKDLKNATRDMKSTKGEDAERTKYKCEKCGRTMVIRWGKQGPFLGCEGYMDEDNKCSFTQELNEDGTIRPDISGPIEGAEFDGSPIHLKHGRYGYYLGTEAGKNARIPKDVKLEEIDAAMAVEYFKAAAEAEKPLGKLESGEEVFAKLGRYGPYLQVLGGEKKRNIALPAGTDLSAVTIEQARTIAALPRDLGTHPDSEAVIELHFGKYGPFVKCGDETRSIGSEPLDEMDLEKALALLAQPKKKRGRRKGSGKKT